MKAILKLAFLPLLLLNVVEAYTQDNDGSAIIYGRVIVNKDSIHPLLPETVIVEKEWPITFNQFELASIDSTNFSFKIWMDLGQLTYGNLIINFHSEIDTTTKESTGYWRPSARPGRWLGAVASSSGGSHPWSASSSQRRSAGPDSHAPKL